MEPTQQQYSILSRYEDSMFTFYYTIHYWEFVAKGVMVAA